MKNLPNIVKFSIKFIVFYFAFALLFQIPILKQLNLGVYTTLQQTVFNIFHPTIKTDFDILKDKQEHEEPFDIGVFIYDKRNKTRNKPLVQVNQEARYLSIIPFSFLLALVLSTPSHWKRKIIGLICSGLFLLIYLALKFTFLFNTNAPELSPDGFSWWMSLSKLMQPCFRTHEAMFLLIVPIWMLGSLSLKDAQWFLK